MIAKLKNWLAILACACVGQTANAGLLTFDGAICGGVACVDLSPIDANYGSTAEVTVSYASRTLTGNGGVVVLNNLNFWTVQYSDLTNVAYAEGSSNNVAEIRLAANPGYSVTLDSFDLGAWPNNSPGPLVTTQVTIYDLSYNVLDSTGLITVDWALHSHFTYGLTRNDGFIIQFGPDAYTVGIDNISFSSARRDSNPVSEPGSVFLMGIALLGLAGMRRKHRA